MAFAALYGCWLAGDGVAVLRNEKRVEDVTAG